MISDLHISFIDAVRRPGEFQVRTDASINFGSVLLNPPPDRDMNDLEASLPHHLLKVAVA